jgi:hypothetical protein
MAIKELLREELETALRKVAFDVPVRGFNPLRWRKRSHNL